MNNNIREDHRRAFEALTGGEAGNFYLSRVSPRASLRLPSRP